MVRFITVIFNIVSLELKMSFFSLCSRSLTFPAADRFLLLAMILVIVFTHDFCLSAYE